MYPILIIGHSYIRRLEALLQKSEKDWNLDQLDHIEWFYRGGMKLAHVWDGQAASPALVKLMDRVRPHHVYLEIGTNDISMATHKQTLDIAKQLLAFITWLISKGVNFVAWGKVVYRLKDKRKVPRIARYDFGVDLHQFEENRLTLANYIKDHLPPKACMWMDSRIESRKNLMSPDGVHLSDQGMSRYYYSVRGALLFMSARCRESGSHYHLTRSGWLAG